MRAKGRAIAAIMQSPQVVLQIILDGQKFAVKAAAIPCGGDEAADQAAEYVALSSSAEDLINGPIAPLSRIPDGDVTTIELLDHKWALQTR